MNSMKQTIRLGLTVSAIALAIMAGIMVWAYQALPEGRIPLHWNVHNDPDRWGTRTEALWSLAIIPVVTVFMTLLLAVLPSLDPRKTNLEKSSKVYAISWVSTAALLAICHVGIGLMTINGATGGETDKAFVVPFVRIVIAATGLLFILLGNYLPKTRPNWFLGIRTPWTLSSDDTWEKTHRLGGRLFLLSGIIGLITAFTLNGIWLALAMPLVLMPSVLICVVYSYLVWRRASDKQIGNDLIV